MENTLNKNEKSEKSNQYTYLNQVVKSYADEFMLFVVVVEKEIKELKVDRFKLFIIVKLFFGYRLRQWFQILKVSVFCQLGSWCAECYFIVFKIHLSEFLARKTWNDYFTQNKNIVIWKWQQVINETSGKKINILID